MGYMKSVFLLLFIFAEIIIGFSMFTGGLPSFLVPYSILITTLWLLLNIFLVMAIILNT